ncbi:MAG: SDR family NAD(P)-dependent oxidoreductase, partial [Alphaproteobacteria bacterium]|nr:SDR family NAD(P)-dependent oxidoreductase [Alphaproteobacteria bacterium]
MADIDLTGKTALITGGGRGMGRSMAIALINAGASVTITAAREEAELDEVVRQIGDSGGAGRIHGMLADVTDDAECLRARDVTHER